MNYESRVERDLDKARAAADSTATAPTLAGVTPKRVAGRTVGAEVPSVNTLGAYMDPKHRYWFNGIGPVPSVTTILGILDKPAVGVWKAKAAAKLMLDLVHSEPEWADRAWAMAGDGDMRSRDDLVLQVLKDVDKERDTAAVLGSSVHLLADLVGASESDPTAFQVSDDTYPYVQAFRGFLDRYGRSSIVSSEHMVWSLNGYAGTYDLLMQLPKQKRQTEGDTEGCNCVNCEPGPFDVPTDLWLIDIKTSKGFYPEYGLQLAGYRWADSIVLPGNPDPYPMPQIQSTGVLHLRPDLYPDTGWRLIEYPTTYKDDYIAFLAALELYQWKGKGRFTKSKLHKL